MIVTTLLLAACLEELSNFEEQARQQARRFAEAYFNYDLKRAMELATPESGKWLRFAASSVTQEDLDVINSQEEAASAVVDGISYVNDSMVIATVSVGHFFKKDSIGSLPHLVDGEERFPLTIVRREGKCYVRMEGLPRSERQSRD